MKTQHTPIVKNEICVDPKGNLFIGSLANKLIFGELNKKLNDLIASALKDLKLYGQYMVIEQDCTLRAAQSTKELAMQYMKEDRILISMDFLSNN